MAKKKTQSKKGGVKRQLELRWMTARELRKTANPLNWRRHPESQRRAWNEVFGELGWVGYCLLNETTGRLLDGHMRVEETPADEKVPVVVGRWSEEEERLILASHDPVAAMAEVDPEVTAKLLGMIETSLPAVHAMLEVLEKELDDALKDKPKEKDDDEGGGEGGGEASVRVKPTHALMVRCHDRLEQQMLVDRFIGEGLKPKAVKV